MNRLFPAGPLMALALAVLCGAASCKDKVPYSGSPANGEKGGPWSRSAPPGGPAEPLPVAVILTPAGSILATSRSGGRDLDIRKIPRHVFVRDDGALVTFKVQRNKRGKAGPKARESEFVSLVMGEGDQDQRELFPGKGHDRPDLKALGAIDPDMASLFYHRESVQPLGISGPLFSWIISIEGFLGGMHPYAEKRLLVVDAEIGDPVDLRPRFKHRKPDREGRRGLGSEECVTRFAGVAPIDWIGGNATWVSVFTHEFEVCRGRTRMVKVPPPADPLPRERAREVRMARGVFEIPNEGVKVAGVADWRVAPDAEVAILLMSLGLNDRLSPPWRLGKAGKTDRRTREMRLWFKGMEAPVVISRVTRVLSVQFLNDHPDPKSVLAAFAAID